MSIDDLGESWLLSFAAVGERMVEAKGGDKMPEADGEGDVTSAMVTLPP